MLLVEHGTVYTPTQAIADGAVLVNGRQIEAVGKRSELAVPPGTQHIDAHGGSIAPGFINLHVHGVAGHNAGDTNVDNLHMIASLFAGHGVTCFLLGVGPAPLPAMLASLQASRQARATQKEGAEILGVHLEGPYLNAAERGAMLPELLRAALPDEYNAWLEYADIIKEVTVAPEVPGVVELTAELKRRGILVSAGHSIAIDEELSRAADAGLSHATHMFCNMGTLRRVNIRRVAGLVESVLLDDRLTIELITDGYHIAPSLMKLGLKVKGRERTAIITDGSRLTGMPPGVYTSASGRQTIVEERITYVADRSAYAGSVATMDQCLRVAIKSMDLSLADGLRMASLTPATIIGVADHKGSLEPGKDADIVILDGDLHVAQTIVGGKVARALEPA